VTLTVNPEASAADARVRAGSPHRFGYEWAYYDAILPESKLQLERWMGSTRLDSMKGKRVLDVGCGMGRNPYWFLQAGAAEVVACDVDPQSLGAARANLEPFANARVLEKSAYDLDGKELGVFDRVTCIGVLHHLLDPVSALRHLWSCVAPGGDLVLWCYGREGNEWLLPIIHGLRFAGSRLPVGVCHGLARAIAVLSWPAVHLVPFRTEYYRNLRNLSFVNFESIIFDQMLPQVAAYWTRDDLTQLVGLLPGAAPTIELVQGNSWHVRVEKRSVP
jgi:SAM-dependent methyltransferase